MARQERKLVTALFADLVGFTARAEQMDPEDVAALLSGYHSHVKAELERFGGTVEKFIGDAVMALFGAPAAHEDDPERAVRAALAIREWASEQGIELRIGIATGEALVTLGGEPLAAGDVVNTGARLQQAAPTGGILVGQQTYRATRDTIEYRDAEPVEAKGKAAPVTAWEALHARARVAVERLHGAPLVGRSRELALLTEALDRTRQERAPQLVTLVGVPGIGKSRLVFELSQAAASDRELISWHQGRCLPYGEGVTFWALGEIVKAEAGILESDAPELAGRKLREAAGDPWVESHLRPLVGLSAEAELGGDRRTESFAAWRQFFEALAEERPLVLVVEDLHWADDELLDFVDHLVEWASGVPLLVVCTARPELLERRPAWGGGKPNALTISLAPLSDEETARLIGELLERSVLPAGTLSELLVRAGGNPLYAEQFARMLVERPTDEELPLPETVQGVIAARLDLLEPEEKALLQDAAVLGKTFWAGGLASVAGVGRRAVEERLHALERKDFLRRERRSAVADETQYFFLHLLVRDVAYGQIPRAKRAEKHRLAAEWIESLGRAEDHAEMLAHHYAGALEFAQAAGQDTAALADRARFSLRDAGDRAFALHARAAAERFYQAALELWPEDEPERVDLLVRYGKAADDVDALGEARDALLERGDREAAADAEAELSVLRWFRGEGDLRWEHILRAAALLEDAPASRAKAEVLDHLARHRMRAGALEEAIEVSREAIAMAEQLGLEDIRANALSTVGVSRFHLGDSAGLEDVERSIAVALEVNSPAVVRGYTNLSAALMYTGELARAGQAAEEGRRAASRFGQLLQLRFLEEHLAKQLYWAGRWDECIELVDRGISESEAGAPHYVVTGLRLYRALIRLARGDLDGAIDDTQRALLEARRTGDRQMLNPALAVGARILCAAGREDDAAALADELAANWVATHAAGQGFQLCWVVRRLGRLERFLEVLEANPLRTAWQEAARAVAFEDFARAAEVYARIGALPDQASARQRAAEALDAEGRRAEAEAELERALIFWRSVGAVRYLQESEALPAA